LHNPAYHNQIQRSQNQSAETESAGRSETCETAVKQPWQLAAMQKAADFSGSSQEASERCQHVTALLSGMLNPDVAQRMTARQLAGDKWLQHAGSSELAGGPVVL